VGFYGNDIKVCGLNS